MHCSRRLIVQTLVFNRSYLHHQVSPPETLVVKGGTTWARNGRWILPENVRLPRNIQGSFTCRKSTIWDKWFYFPSEGRRTEDFFRAETASAGFEPANLGTKGRHATSRPPKPLYRYTVTILIILHIVHRYYYYTNYIRRYFYYADHTTGIILSSVRYCYYRAQKCTSITITSLLRTTVFVLQTNFDANIWTMNNNKNYMTFQGGV